MHPEYRRLKTLGLDSLRHAQTFPGILLGAEAAAGERGRFDTHCPIDGVSLAQVGMPSHAELEAAIARAQQAFAHWRGVPPPRRGELVRRIGQLARARKTALADLITLEVGKTRQEALGEVQELIDICDFAVGLSRQLYGLTIASERPEHRMMEQWHPLGPVVVITAFNFPMAVWAWNAMLALVCGNSLLWKPAPQAPLCALACQRLLTDAADGMDEVPADLSGVVQGNAQVARDLISDPRIRLVSATGSTAMGRAVAQQVSARLGRYLLELGGNNALIVTPSADLDLALRAIVFAAVGTTGQRCTTLRRLIVHEHCLDALETALCRAYASLRIGNPFDEAVHLGPLISTAAAGQFDHALQQAQQQGGIVRYGGTPVTEGVPAGGAYVRPALVRMPGQTAIVREETFAPLLYLLPYRDFDEAIALHNDVPQGLSSAVFTRDLLEAEHFLGPAGSDCGIANVNIGTSGAEIGGAFGGEKDTGGGRESGSDAWKAYMRRATNTLNYGKGLPLAQGIRFDLD
ncbi:MAG: aldehyde dehydrogenase family protein [Gammaproteobacteria bacterium]|nr:aldehyde dehydrogenase family protein [Gammaproteobacteria bacterium]